MPHEYDVHVYEPGESEPKSLRETARLATTTDPLDAEAAITEAMLRNSGHLRTRATKHETSWVPVFRVPDTDTWLGLTTQIHPAGLDLKVFERASKYVRDFEDAAHEDHQAALEHEGEI